MPESQALVLSTPELLGNRTQVGRHRRNVRADAFPLLHYRSPRLLNLD
jgi:hypothetical protein